MNMCAKIFISLLTQIYHWIYETWLILLIILNQQAHEFYLQSACCHTHASLYKETHLSAVQWSKQKSKRKAA